MVGVIAAPANRIHPASSNRYVMKMLRDITKQSRLSAHLSWDGFRLADDTAIRLDGHRLTGALRYRTIVFRDFDVFKWIQLDYPIGSVESLLHKWIDRVLRHE
jgi:hypothetical protein